jgi:hypothetical protein
MFPAAMDRGVASLPAAAFDLGHRHACDAAAASASFTSPSLSGLMTAVISCMDPDQRLPAS